MIYKKNISLETLQIFVPCLCFIFIYRKIISYKILQCFPLFLSNHSLRMPVTNWLTDSLTYGLDYADYPDNADYEDYAAYVDYA